MSAPTVTPIGPRWSMRWRTSVRPPSCCDDLVRGQRGAAGRPLAPRPGHARLDLGHLPHHGGQPGLLDLEAPADLDAGAVERHDAVDGRGPCGPALHVDEDVPDGGRRSVDLDAAVRDHVPNGTGMTADVNGCPPVRAGGGRTTQSTRWWRTRRRGGLPADDPPRRRRLPGRARHGAGHLGRDRSRRRLRRGCGRAAGHPIRPTGRITGGAAEPFSRARGRTGGARCAGIDRGADRRRRRGGGLRRRLRLAADAGRDPRLPARRRRAGRRRRRAGAAPAVLLRHVGRALRRPRRPGGPRRRAPAQGGHLPPALARGDPLRADRSPRLPWVRLVAVTWLAGGGGGRPTTPTSTCFVVTVDGRLWLARGLTIGVVKLAARAPSSRGVRLCPNYLVTASTLDLPERDLYTAHELAQLVPLFGPDDLSRAPRPQPVVPAVPAQPPRPPGADRAARPAAALHHAVAPLLRNRARRPARAVGDGPQDRPPAGRADHW